jgi:hypothetical protein
MQKTCVGTFHGNLPQVVNTRSQVTIVKQDFNNNTLTPLPRYDNKTAHIVTKSILVRYNVITLRKLANAPWYISNATLHNDLRIPYVTEVIRTYAKNHKNRTAQNNSQLIRELSNQPEIRRRLNRMWPEDHVTEVIRTYAKNHKNRTAQNNSQLIRELSNQPEIGRRLDRMWPEELIR